MAIPELMLHNFEVYKRHAEEFQRTFGPRLMPKFWNHLTGFDVIELDNWLKVPDGKSTEDVVREKYGEEAVALCRRLLKLELSTTPLPDFMLGAVIRHTAELETLTHGQT